MIDPWLQQLVAWHNFYLLLGSAAATLTGLLFAVLAWLLGAGLSWLLGGLLLGMVIPYTLVVIRPTNTRLLAPDLDKHSAEARGLLLRWADGMSCAVCSAFWPWWSFSSISTIALEDDTAHARCWGATRAYRLGPSLDNDAGRAIRRRLGASLGKGDGGSQGERPWIPMLYPTLPRCTR
jgi:hypothetical protein